jgi:type VI secretion system secreted protein Hcp
MAIYMKYGPVEGEVTTKGFDKWIELNSFQWGLGRAFSSMAGGNVSQREGSLPSVSEITVTMNTGKPTVKLLTEALKGKGNIETKIAFVRTEQGGQPIDYMLYTLTNTAISGYSVSSGGDRPSESISLNFSKIEVKYSDVSTGGTSTPQAVTYDMTTTSVS